MLPFATTTSLPVTSNRPAASAVSDSSIGAAFGTEAFRGHDGLREWASALGEGFEDFAADIDEAKITTEGVLLLRGHNHGRSRGTHIDLSTPAFWQQVTFRDGLAFMVVQFDEPPPEWDDATPITQASQRTRDL